MSRHLHRPGAAASHGIRRAGADLCAALSCAGLLMHGALAGAQVVDRILAVVDRQVITLADVRLAAALRLVPAREEAEVLDRLVQRTLVLGEVARYAPGDPSEAEVDARLQAVRTGAGEVDVDRALRRAGLDAAWLRAWVRQALLAERYLDQRFGVTAVPTDDQVEESCPGTARGVRDSRWRGHAAGHRAAPRAGAAHR